MRKSVRREIPLGLRPAPPRAATRAGDIAENRIERCKPLQLLCFAKPDIYPGARRARWQIGHAAGRDIMREPVTIETGRQRQRLAAAARTIIENTHARRQVERLHRSLTAGVLKLDITIAIERR